VIVIVMGVSGSGKSTIGSVLAASLGWPFLEGDALHPAANVAKMAAGHPLTDADRLPWLQAIGQRMDAWTAAGVGGVVACSALRRAYRDVLRGDTNGRRGGPGGVRFVLLDVDRDELADRMAHRHGHFMPPALLDSQLATLERPGTDERAVTVRLGVDTTPAQVVDKVRAELRLPVG
jgi:carbohydrate kinase (thermoresistant glucokinase family)